MYLLYMDDKEALEEWRQAGKVRPEGSYAAGRVARVARSLMAVRHKERNAVAQVIAKLPDGFVAGREIESVSALKAALLAVVPETRPDQILDALLRLDVTSISVKDIPTAMTQLMDAAKVWEDSLQQHIFRAADLELLSWDRQNQVGQLEGAPNVSGDGQAQLQGREIARSAFQGVVMSRAHTNLQLQLHGGRARISDWLEEAVPEEVYEAMGPRQGLTWEEIKRIAANSKMKMRRRFKHHLMQHSPQKPESTAVSFQKPASKPGSSTLTGKHFSTRMAQLAQLTKKLEQKVEGVEQNLQGQLERYGERHSEETGDLRERIGLIHEVAHVNAVAAGRVCYQFQETGSCRFPNCKFAHTRGGGGGGMQSPSAFGRGRTVCRDFRRTGTCSYGARCKFSHDDEGGNQAQGARRDERSGGDGGSNQRFCQDFVDGDCAKTNCRLRHDEQLREFVRDKYSKKSDSKYGKKSEFRRSRSSERKRGPYAKREERGSRGPAQQGRRGPHMHADRLNRVRDRR
jgi:hypothetical protein